MHILELKGRVYCNDFGPLPSPNHCYALHWIDGFKLTVQGAENKDVLKCEEILFFERNFNNKDYS